MDEVVAHARIVRINAQNVGGDIIHYHRSLDEIDDFVKKIEKCGFAFLLFSIEVEEEIY